MNSKTVKSELSHSYFTIEEQILMNFNIYRHRENWRWYISLLSGFSNDDHYVGKGFAWNTRSYNPPPVSEAEKVASPMVYDSALIESFWKEKQVSYVDQIIELCGRNQIQLFLVLLPNAPNFLNPSYIFAEHDAVFQRFAHEKPGVTLVDLALEDYEKSQTQNKDYSDSIHLNRYGSIIVTKQIIEILKKISLSLPHLQTGKSNT